MLPIVGAGMTGLLAARMLGRYHPVVYEVQGSLPNNHSAVLRFSSSLVGEILGIEFRKVNLVKNVLPWRNQVADTLAYAKKNLGTYESSRSIALPERTSSSERYIAPPNLIEQMADGLDIKFNSAWSFDNPMKAVSTIPMPMLMNHLDYPERNRVKFVYRSGVNIRGRIRNCDAYATLLVPDPSIVFSRVSITGDQLIVECPGVTKESLKVDKIGAHAAELMGINFFDLVEFEAVEQKYAKIAPIPDDNRRAFIHWASTVKGRAWQLGRFATWRPGLLLDSLPHDVRLIERWMRSKTPAADIEMHEAKRMERA